MLKNKEKHDGGLAGNKKPPTGEVSTDQRVEALVRFIARRAAEEDYQELLRTLDPQDN